MEKIYFMKFLQEKTQSDEGSTQGGIPYVTVVPSPGNHHSHLCHSSPITR